MAECSPVDAARHGIGGMPTSGTREAVMDSDGMDCYAASRWPHDPRAPVARSSRKKETTRARLPACSEDDGRHERRWLNLEGDPEAFHRFDPYGSLTAFDQGNVRSVQTGSIGQLLLRHPARVSQLPQAFSETFGIDGSHVDNDPDPQTMRPQTKRNMATFSAPRGGLQRAIESWPKPVRDQTRA